MPETRSSLLIRIRNRTDQAAWHEFVEIYRPVIVRMARHKGMQQADADDIAQQVLLAISRAVEQRGHNRQRAKFRTWLGKVAQNAILNMVSRTRPDRGSGNSAIMALLRQRASCDGPNSELFRLERRRELFRWAARHVRKEFHRTTWDAFWLTAVEGHSVEVVAQRLAKSRGVVYAARSRVVRALQDKVAEFEWDG